MIALFAAVLALAPLPSLHGDFDHDGRPDAARVVRKGDGYQLIVRRGAAAARPLVLLTMSKATDFYLGSAPGGEFSTACGKDIGPDGVRCATPRVLLAGRELAFGFREASDAVAIWKGDRFDVVWLTD